MAPSITLSEWLVPALMDSYWFYHHHIYNSKPDPLKLPFHILYHLYTTHNNVPSDHSLACTPSNFCTKREQKYTIERVHPTTDSTIGSVVYDYKEQGNVERRFFVLFG